MDFVSFSHEMVANFVVTSPESFPPIVPEVEVHPHPSKTITMRPAVVETESEPVHSETPRDPIVIGKEANTTLSSSTPSVSPVLLGAAAILLLWLWKRS